MGNVGSKTRSLADISESQVYPVETTFSTWYSWYLVRMFASMKSWTSSKMGHPRSKTRCLSQIIEELRLATKGLWFKSLLFNAIPHNPLGSGERLQGHHSPLVFWGDNDLFELPEAIFYFWAAFSLSTANVSVWRCLNFCCFVKGLRSFKPCRIDWLNGVLHCFQQYFSHVAATAHTFHAFPGFHQY